MIEALTTGILLGLSAGLAPGPLLTLVIAETLKFGLRAGVRVALAPLITDLPIVLVTLLLLKELQQSKPILGAIALGGAAFLAYLAYDNFRASAPKLDSPVAARSISLRKGVLTNFLSPHPYLFWLGIGAPFLARAGSRASGLAFITGFYLLLIGSKLVLALLVARSRDFLQGRPYRIILKGLGLALLALALLLARQGMHLLQQGMQ